ncbi:sulfatase-like hydrolase/transferase [Granulicella sp. 5B5]|nr:sulfatase-like hydrolase/transferase [Granulicella sp. 5B5]
MKSSFRLLSCALILAGATAPNFAQSAAAAKTQGPIVIVITLDGFPVRALEDPRLPMPVLRSIVAHGAVAKAMKPINPTVTWPNHTALVTGVDASQHHVVANGLIEFPADGSALEVEPWIDKDQLVHARTLYEAAAEKGLTTAQVDWVAIYGAKGVNWQFGERPDIQGQIPQELVARGIVTREQIEHFDQKSTPAWRDQVWTSAAVDIIEEHTPNLLLLHLLETDSIQHEYAPLTPAAYAAYAYADHCLGRVVEAVRAAGILDRTTFFILSDHGFATYTHTISPNVALLEQGLIRKEGNSYKGDVWIKAEGGAAELFIRNPARRKDLVPKLKAYFASLPGIQHAYTNEEAYALGIPAEANTDQAPQLYLTASPDYAFSDDLSGPLARQHAPLGAHGYLNTMSDMQALFVASGAAVKPGVTLGPISNLRVAPTIARILNVSLPDAKEPALDEILR